MKPRPKLITAGVPFPTDGQARCFYYASADLLSPPPGLLRRFVKRMFKCACKSKVGPQHSSSLTSGNKNVDNVSGSSATVLFFAKLLGRRVGQGGDARQGDTVKKEDSVINSHSSGHSLSARLASFFRRRWYARVTMGVHKNLDLTAG